ncbi:MAG TPA: hypothetical protein VGJ70_03805 [Solirubrobacteraceae bacterium]|jgi:hypothetical protein
MKHQQDPRAAQAAEQQRRLAELRERQARQAQMRAQPHAPRLPGHGHRVHGGK